MRETTQLASEPNIKIQRPGPEKFDESLGFCPPLILSVHSWITIATSSQKR
jgi:hypothetical protein